jgi:hypothetical protein
MWEENGVVFKRAGTKAVSSSGVLKETFIENPWTTLRATLFGTPMLLDTNFLVPRKFTRSDIFGLGGMVYPTPGEREHTN